MVEDSSECLRQKAMKCVRAAKSVEDSCIRDALEGLAFILMEAACALDSQQSILDGSGSEVGQV